MHPLTAFQHLPLHQSGRTVAVPPLLPGRFRCPFAVMMLDIAQLQAIRPKRINRHPRLEPMGNSTDLSVCT
jgi:hypothetical protein